MMVIDRKSEDEPGVRKKSLKSYTSMILKESSLTAVSDIALTKNIPRRVFKAFVLLFCFTGFFYQSYTFLSHIFDYPTIVDLEIVSSKEVELPGLTFCNNNGINRRKFCAEYPDRCFEADEAFCSKHESYCEVNKTTMVPYEQYYEMVNNLTVEQLSVIGQDIDELLTSQRNFEHVRPQGPFIRSKSLAGMGRMGCYSMFSLVNSPEEPETTTVEKMLAFPFLSLLFDVNENEEFIPGHRTGMFFSVHSPYEGSNPSDKGIFMEPGRTYKIYITMEKELLLPYPYTTDCLNYTEVWESQNRTGPRIQEMCRHKCLLDATTKYLNCTAVFTLFPSDLRICDFAEFVTEAENLSDEFDPCDALCKDDCAKTKYTKKLQVRFTSDYFWSSTPDEDDSKLIAVELYIDDSEIITYRHRPQYLDVEAFSYIGGFIGVWLGISLIQITDFVESLFRILRYAIKKRSVS